VFFPLKSGPAIATDRETVQMNFDDVIRWAEGLTRPYLEGALERAINIEKQVPITAQLAAAEYDALGEASLLEAMAEDDRTQAAAARAEADALREQRIATEDAIRTVDETTATIEAVTHERAATQARAAGPDASQRRQKAHRQMSQTDDQGKRKRRPRRKALTTD
jgi:hypothetical protein